MSELKKPSWNQEILFKQMQLEAIQDIVRINDLREVISNPENPEDLTVSQMIMSIGIMD